MFIERMCKTCSYCPSLAVATWCLSSDKDTWGMYVNLWPKMLGMGGGGRYQVGVGQLEQMKYFEGGKCRFPGGADILATILTTPEDFRLLRGVI